MRLLEGEVGRWLAIEWLPPYLLVACIVPLVAFFKVPADEPLTALLHVLGAGDLLAVNFCLILSALGVAVGTKTYTAPRSYALEIQVVFLGLFMLLAYAAVKIAPVNAHAEFGRALAYSALNIAVSFWATMLICHMKMRI